MEDGKAVAADAVPAKTVGRDGSRSADRLDLVRSSSINMPKEAAPVGADRAFMIQNGLSLGYRFEIGLAEFVIGRQDRHTIVFGAGVV